MKHLGARLSALIDGELSLARTERALAHLAACERCRREAAELRALKRRMHTLGEAMAQSGLNERLLAMSPGDHGGDHGAAVRMRVRHPGPRVAVGLLLVAAAIPAAGFLAGGGQHASGPRVNPAEDVFIQHTVPPAYPAGRVVIPGIRKPSPSPAKRHHPGRVGHHGQP